MRLGGSDYLPGLYVLLQVAIFPGEFLGSILQLDHCTIFADNIGKSCLIETVCLKAVTVFWATVWIGLLQKAFPEHRPKDGWRSEHQILGNRELEEGS